MLTGVATLQSNPLPLRDRDLLRTRAYVDGSWVEGDSGETFPVVDPATGATIAEVPRLGAAETRRAIEAAERALPAWRGATARERARILRRIADLMVERQAVIASDQKRVEYEWASNGGSSAGGGPMRDHDDSRSR